MSLEVCQHLGEKLADRHTCPLLCYRFPECLPLEGEEQESPDGPEQLTQRPRAVIVSRRTSGSPA
jgi:hypothetical protein